MLFVLNEQGVPSVGRTIRVGITAVEPPVTPDATAFAGGFGGAAFTLACNANEVLVGVKGTTDAYVYQVSPLCTRVNQAGDWLDTPVARGIKGSVGATSYTKLCPAKSAISGFRGYFVPYVNQLDLECRTLTPAGKLSGDGAFLGPVGNPTGTAQGPWRCPSGNPGYALYGRSTGWINNFGIQCRQAPVVVSNTAPVVANPGSQTTPVNVAIDLGVVASDAEGNTLAFAATGLPPGLAINPSTGRITGTPTAPGNYPVLLTVSDGSLGASANFTWVITNGPLFVLDPLPPTTPKLVGETVNYTATSHDGTDVMYSWFFDDGTPATDYSSSPAITHTFAHAGIFYVTVTATSARSPALSQTVAQAVHLPLTANRPAISGNIVYDTNGGGRVWVANQDNNTVSVFSTSTHARLAEITVGAGPRTLAVAPNGSVWVANKFSATLSIIDPSSMTVSQSIALPYASQPFGIAFAPTGGFAYVVLEGSGRLLKLDASTGTTVAGVAVGRYPRHVSVNSDGTNVYVARFITPPLPGEGTAVVTPGSAGGEVLVVSAASMSVTNTITLAHSFKADAEIQGSGIPNYLGAVTLSPDGSSAWIPSKQDNILRGALRNGANLNFQNTVRAIASRIDLGSGAEDLASRIDIDNASLASAAVFDPFGNYLFVALETSREVAVLDAQGTYEIFRFAVGRAPQGLAISNDGRRLYVNNFMDRTVGVFDLSRLMDVGESTVSPVATLSAVATEALSAQVLKGKQFFYDAKDPRLARDAYLSCASCHNDGGNDGRTWDFTGQGEGLRNTIAMRGRAGGHGFLHWSGNFDEVQDFEGQIRTLAGGTGLMSDTQFNAGTRSQPLGDAKAGVNADLDALAAYVNSLSTFANSPNRNGDGSLTAAGAAGRAVFQSSSCASCHGGAAFSLSAAGNLKDVGTLKPSSGKRLGAALTGIDIPTLRDVWATAPYLHDGSAPTLAAAVVAHSGVTLSGADLDNLVAYLGQIDATEPAPPIANSPPVLSNPGNQAGAAGVTVNLALVASDAEGDVLTYGATNLPPPLSISTSTGRITGIPSATGTYNVTVTARDSTTTVSQSFTWTITVRDIVAPSKLPSFTAASLDGRPFLTWGEATDNVGVAGYIVYRSSDGTQGAEVARTPGTVFEWTDMNFVEKLKYTYSLKAFDAAGNLSPLTAFRYVTPSQAPTVSTLSASLSNGKPALSWTAATDNVGVTGYIVSRSTNGGAGAEIARTPSLTFIDTSAVSGVTYTYNIRAYDAVANQATRSNLVTIQAQ
jgi:YVTN family beta-propeller protein